MLDCINIFSSDVFKSLIHGDVNKTVCCNLVMLIKHFIVHKELTVTHRPQDRYHAQDNCNNKKTK
jgi:hypothetical protein